MKPQISQSKDQDEILVSSGVITCEHADVAKVNAQLFLEKVSKTCSLRSSVPPGL
jgi:hypothetical protein